MVQDLIKSREELEEIANALAAEIAHPEENIVSRYMRVSYDTVSFANGKKAVQKGSRTNLNQEWMSKGTYATTNVDDLLPHNVKEVSIARDLEPHRFQLPLKGVELPTEQGLCFMDIPTEIERYDQEFAEFTKEHQNTGLTRTLSVEQRVIVNSKGGAAIQSIPFFMVSYSHAYMPLPTSRDIAAVCTSNQDIARFTNLIKFLSDPTTEKKIKGAASFSEAFGKLHALASLQYSSLEEAGIPLAGLYDVVVVTGVPVHEVFGHHFEEPMDFLSYNEPATFRHGQAIRNENITLIDSPHLDLDGFKVSGYTIVDAYGRKRQTRTHIKDGKCIEFLGSEYADLENLNRHLNLENTENQIFVGNTCQHTDGQFPQPRMSCTILDGKTEDMDLEGKIVIVPHSGRTSPQEKTYLLHSMECYVIRDGIPRRTIPLRVTGGINQALANMVLLNDWNYNPGECGKAAPQSRGMAYVPVSEFTRTQIWRDQQVFPLPLPDKYLQKLMKK